MDEFLVGEIIPVPYMFAPEGTLYCDGQEYPVQLFQLLFALIGFTFGGNGSSTFRVPNLKGFEPNPNVHYVIVTDGMFPDRY
ncbi:phage tail protein [Clostridium boliviensis]|uniref:Phage tail protein n=1 Tax=Clostridium boliviensis TaxID=318465 RepID=A0ABU4GPS7_9CLOT|nr:phage tail protein [Clostridium boliviensis]MDW2799640.1 phage tail protein [Clostridium boliviensis]